MPFWQLYYHVVWATRERLPLLTPEIEPLVYDLIRGKAIRLEGSVFALNGLPDHVHLVAAIPPKLSVADFIGQVKGIASSQLNKAHMRELPLYWRAEYGVFSFDQKRLPYLIDYVDRQKQHHAQGRTYRILERTTPADVQTLRDAGSGYRAEGDDWLRQLDAEQLD